MGVMHADMVMKSIIPIIMAGVLGIYGLIVAVLLGSSSKRPQPNTIHCFDPAVTIDPCLEHPRRAAPSPDLARANVFGRLSGDAQCCERRKNREKVQKHREDCSTLQREKSTS